MFVSKDAANNAEIGSITSAALRGAMTEVMARRMHALGAEATVAVSLAINARMAQLGGTAAVVGPHTPSAAIPAYAKGHTGKKRPGQPGGRVGHEGHRRPIPSVIDRREEIEELKVCPECHGKVLPARRRRKRTIEDIPMNLRLTLFDK